MMRRGVAIVLLAITLALEAACSSGDGAQSDGTGGGASGGTSATAGGSGGATGGDAEGGQAGATGGIGGLAGQDGGPFGAGGATAGGHASAGIGGSAIAATGGTGGSGATDGGIGGSSPTGGGTGGGGALGGGGGAVVYTPCPTNRSPCNILPLGDSITRGVKSSDEGGYRSQLFKLIVAGNQKVTFSGSLSNGPTQVSGQPFPRLHEGHSGWTISQLSPLIPKPALEGKPNIVLLHIGTNDIGSRDPAGMAMRLDALLEKIAQNAPDALIVVAQITAARNDNDIRDAYNAKIPGIVQSHVAKGQHIISVDVNKIPMAGLSSDGVHPNDQGYASMAGVWYAAIKQLLPH